jgi:hypothetical protein
VKNETAAPGAPLAELTSRALDPGALLTGDDPSARREARAEAARRGVLILPRAAVEAAIDAARAEGAQQAGGARAEEVQRALDALCANEGETLAGAAARVRRELDAWPTLMQGAWPLGVPAPGTAEWVSTLRHELGAQPGEGTVGAARRALAEGVRQARLEVMRAGGCPEPLPTDPGPGDVVYAVRRVPRDAGLSPAGGALRRDLAAALDLEAPTDEELVGAARRARAGEVALGRVRASVGALDGEDVLAALDRWCAEHGGAEDAARLAQVPWRVFAARCWQLLSTALDRELRGDDDLRQEVLGRLRSLVGVAADAKQARREVVARDGEALSAAVSRALREGDQAAHLRGYLDALHDVTGADRAALPRDLTALEQMARKGRLRADVARRAAVLECLVAAGASFGLPSKIDPDVGISRLREHVADLRSTAAVAATADAAVDQFRRAAREEVLSAVGLGPSHARDATSTAQAVVDLGAGLGGAEAAHPLDKARWDAALREVRDAGAGAALDEVWAATGFSTARPGTAAEVARWVSERAASEARARALGEAVMLVRVSEGPIVVVGWDPRASDGAVVVVEREGGDARVLGLRDDLPPDLAALADELRRARERAGLPEGRWHVLDRVRALVSAPPGADTVPCVSRALRRAWGRGYSRALDEVQEAAGLPEDRRGRTRPDAAVALLERGAQLCREDESWAAAVGRAEVWRHQVERARRALRLGDGADVGLACERLARSSAWAEPLLARALGFAGADDPVAAVGELRGILDAHPGDDLREAARRALRAAAANASLPAKSLEVALRREARVAGLVRAAALRDALRVVLSGRVSASRGPGHPLLGALVRARSRVSRRDPCRAVAVRQVKIAAEILGGVDGDPCAPTLIELARRAAGDLEDVRRVLSAGTSRHEARDELGALVPQTELGRRVRHLRLTLRGLHRSRGAVWRALSASAGDLPARLPARTCRAVEVALDRAARGAREAALSEAVALASGTALPASPLGDLRLLELALAGAQQRAREVGEQVAWTFGARAALLRAGVSGAEDLDPDGLARAAERLGREADDGRAAAALGLAGASWVPRYRLRGLGVLRDGVMARAAAAAAGVEVSEELHVHVRPLPRGAVLHDPATLPAEAEEALSRAVGYAAGSGDAAGVAQALRSVLAALSPGESP